MPPLPIAINRDGVTLFANPTYLRTFGYQEMSEVIGTPVTQRFAPECRERLRQRAIRRQRGDTVPVASEGVGLRLDGSRFSFLLQSVHIELPDGPAILAYYTDLTELQRAEEELRKLAFHLREANAALTRLSNQDGLTSLANRRHFDEFLERELRRTRRSRKPLSLLLIDIDDFKAYNDQYGHLAGDECLRLLSRCFRQVVGRLTDLVARYGGEEFAVVLVETDQAGAAKVAERLRTAVADLAIPHPRSTVGSYLTISLGLACWYPDSGQPGPETLIGAAGSALYSVKNSGRNGFAIASLPFSAMAEER